MNIFEVQPEIPPCPRCHHAGEGLSFAFPDLNITVVMCACLNCGFHGPERSSYPEAIAAFLADKPEGVGFKADGPE